MTSTTTQITSLTADYDAIERAIRETSRGRWFLTCYLERNRSAETKMLLSAIAKLESAMRDNGHAINETGNHTILATLRDAIDEARCDLAHMPQVEEAEGLAFTQPVKHFDFENIPSSGIEDLRVIRDASSSIHSAAYALHSAGVFQGVAQQIAESADMIEHACLAQENTLMRASRMAALLCEIEAELISASEDEGIQPDRDSLSFEPDDRLLDIARDRGALDNVVEELSAALSECYDDGGFNGTKSR